MRAYDWTNAPSGPLNGRGNFDPLAINGATDFALLGDDIFIGYRGEYWRDKWQANQLMHFKTDGTFVGQFGMPLYKGVYPNAPGAASNMDTLSLIRVNDVLYFYTNDESGRGMHRWRYDGIGR